MLVLELQVLESWQEEGLWLGSLSGICVPSQQGEWESSEWRCLWKSQECLSLRFLNHARVLEPLIVLIFAYLSYLTAETFHMSGILAITFCGITMKNYVEQVISENILCAFRSKIFCQNISKSSSTTIRSSAHMLANMAEMMIFLFVGVFTVLGTSEDGSSIHK